MDFQRQTGLFDPKKHAKPVLMVGAGGIGGATTLALAKLGLTTISVWDHDTVEKHNQPNQLYGPGDFGVDKVDALKHTVYELTGAYLSPITQRWTGTCIGNEKVLISAVDSMGSRKDIYEKWLRTDIPWLVDGRIGGQVIRVLTANRKNHRTYAKTIVDAKKVAPVPCTQAAIIDVMFSVASLITRATRLILTKKPVEQSLTYDHRNLVFMKG